MKIKHLIITLLGISGILLLPFLAEAQATSNFWKFGSNTVQPALNTWSLKIPQLGSATNPCVKVDVNGLFSTTPCGGGASASGGTWSTTTSTVAGRLVNYPNNTTDIINVGSNSTTTGKFYYDPNTTKGFMNGSFVVGSGQPTYADDNLSVANFVTDLNGYTFVGLQNKNAGSTASTDLVFANNKTTITDYYNDCGISGGNNADPLFTGIGGASAAYCFNTDGPMSWGIGTTTAGSDYNWVISHDGGNSYLVDDIKMKLTNAGRLGIGTTTPMALLNLAGTTSPQFVIGSDGVTESNWGFRNAGGYMFINSINPVTLATSTSPSLSMSPTLNQVAVGTSTFAAGVGLTVGAGFNPVAVLFDSTSATGMYTIYRNSNVDFGYIGSAGVLFTGSGGSKTDLAIRASQNLGLGVGARQMATLTANGNFGIGTTSPYAPLSVPGFGGIVTSTINATSTSASTFAGGITLTGGTLTVVGNITCSASCVVGNNGNATNLSSTLRGAGSADGSAVILSTSGVGTSDSIIFRTGDNGNRRSLFVDTNGNMTVGTSSPLTNETAQFTIAATSTATTMNLLEARTPNLNLGTATTSVFTITSSGVQLASSTPPTLSTCGTSPTINGNNNYGAITTGATASACTATFANGGFPTFASCVITNQSMSVVNAMTYTVSKTAFTVSQTGLGGSIINFRCDGY